MSERELKIYICDSCGREDVQEARESLGFAVGRHLANQAGLGWMTIYGKITNDKSVSYLICSQCMDRAWSTFEKPLP